MAIPLSLAVDLDLRGAPKQIADAINRAQRSIPKIRLDFDGRPLGKISGDIKEFEKSLAASNARVIAFGATTGILYGIVQAFDSLVKSTINVEKRLQDINVIAGGTKATFDKLAESIFKSARNTASGFEEAASAAEEFARQGLSVAEAAKRTNDALVLSRLSGTKAADAVKDLTAALNTFKNEALDTTTIVNKLANVDANFAVSQRDLSEAITRAGASAESAGVSFDKFLGLITSVQQSTARGGAVIGNAFKTIFTRLNTSTTLDALKGIGVQVESLPGKLLPADEILKNLAKTYVTLGDVQKNQIARQVAGIQQINVLKALLADVSKNYSVFTQATQDSANATNEAILRNEELNKTLDALIKTAGANITGLFSKIGSVTIEPTLKGLISSFNNLFQSNSLQDDQSGFGKKIGESVIKGIGDAIGGPGLLVISAVLLKVFTQVSGFALKSVSNLAGLNKRGEEQAKIQSEINIALATGNSYYSKRFSEAKSLQEREQITLDLLKAQNAEIQRQASQYNVIANKLSTAGKYKTGGGGGFSGGGFGGGSSAIPPFTSATPISSALGQLASQVKKVTDQEKIRENFLKRDQLQTKAQSGATLSPAEKSFLTKQGRKDRIAELGLTQSQVDFVKGDPKGRRFIEKNINDPVRQGNQALYARGQQTFIINDIVEQFSKEAKKGFFTGALGGTGGIEKRINKQYGGKLGGEAQSIFLENLTNLKQNRAQKFQQYGLNASLLGPIFGEGALRASGIDENSRGGRIGSSIIQSVGQGGVVASLYPTKTGVAIGALTAAFGTLKAITSNVGDRMEDFLSKIENSNGVLDEQSSAVTQSINAFEELSTLIQKGSPADVIERQSKVFLDSFNGISEGIQKSGLKKAFLNNNVDQARGIQLDQSVSDSRSKKTNEFLARLSSFNEKAGSSEGFLGRFLLPSRTSLANSIQDSGGSGFTKGIFSLLNGAGLNQESLTKSLPRLSKDNLDKLKLNVQSLPFDTSIDPKQIEDLKKNFSPQEIFKAIFEKSKLPTDFVDKIIGSQTNILDQKEILEAAIDKIKSNRSKGDLDKQIKSYGEASQKLIKLTEDTFGDLAYLLESKSSDLEARRNRIATGGEAFLQSNRNTISPEAFNRSQLGLENFKTNTQASSEIAKAVAEGLKKIQIPKNLLGNPESANKIAGVANDILQNPEDLVNALDKLVKVLEEGGADQETLKRVGGIKGDLTREVGGILRNRNNSLQNNSLNRDINDAQSRRERALGFFGGDAISLRNRDFSPLTRGLSSRELGQAFQPIRKNQGYFDNFFNPQRDRRSETARNASVLGDAAESLINLDKEKLLPKDGPMREKYGEVVKQAITENLKYGIDQLESSGLPKDLLKGLRANIPEAAKAQFEEKFPTDKKDSFQLLDDTLSTQSKIIQEQNQYLISSIGGIEGNTQSLNDLSEQLKDSVAKTVDLTAVMRDVTAKLIGGESQAPSQAKGHIPNFSAFAKEVAAIRNGVGGARLGDHPIQKNIRGLGTAVVNSGEKIVRNFMGSGKDAVFNRDMMKSIGDPSHFGNVEGLASGFVPNFAKTFVVAALEGKKGVTDIRRSSAYAKLYSKASGFEFARLEDVPKLMAKNPTAKFISPDGFALHLEGVDRSRIITPTNPTIAVDKLEEIRGNKYLPQTARVSDIQRGYKGGSLRTKIATEFNNRFVVKPIEGTQSQNIFTNDSDFSFKGKRAKDYIAQERYDLIRGGRYGADEYRSHVLGTGRGTAQSIPNATSSRGGLFAGIANPFQTPVNKAIQRAASNAVSHVAEKGVLYGVDLAEVEPAYARAQNRRLGYDKFSSGKGFFGLGKERFFGAIELNPTITELRSNYAVAGGSGALSEVSQANSYASIISGKKPLAGIFDRAFGAINNGRLLPGKSNRGSVSLGGANPFKAFNSVFGGASSLGAKALGGVGKLVLGKTLSGLAGSAISKTGGVLSRVALPLVAGGLGLSSYGSTSALLGQDNNRGVSSFGRKATQAAGLLGAVPDILGQLDPTNLFLGEGRDGESKFELFGNRGVFKRGIEDVATLATLLGQKAGSGAPIYNQNGGEGLSSYLRDRALEYFGGTSEPDIQRQGNSVDFPKLSSLNNTKDSKTYSVFDTGKYIQNNAPRQIDPDAYAKSQGFRNAAQLDAYKKDSSSLLSGFGEYGNGGSDLSGAKSVNATSSPLPPNAVGIDNGYYIDENGKRIGRVNLAGGFIPNFAGYNSKSIYSRSTRKAIRAVGGVIDNSPKALGPLNLLQNLIQNGNLKEARDYISKNGLPSSLQGAGYGPNDLGALAAAIEREKQALVSRGISKNLAGGYIFVGKNHQIGGLGVGNTIDEPAGRFNPNMGILQGINRVNAQGGNPKRSGVPNYANEDLSANTDELISSIRELISALERQNTTNNAQTSTGENGSVKVDHNININASINGEISSNNQAVSDIVTSEIDQLKARLLALEASQKNNKNFVPRPVGTTNVNI